MRYKFFLLYFLIASVFMFLIMLELLLGIWNLGKIYVYEPNRAWLLVEIILTAITTVIGIAIAITELRELFKNH